MKRLIPLLLASAMLSGCSYRYVYGVQDTPIQTASGKPSTIVHTMEYKYFVLFAFVKDVYYECKNDAGSLDCVKICDVKNEEGEKIKCQFVVGF
jgi:hypothetical protein